VHEGRAKRRRNMTSQGPAWQRSEGGWKEFAARALRPCQATEANNWKELTYIACMYNSLKGSS
jgi:hypothetical protein